MLFTVDLNSYIRGHPFKFIKIRGNTVRHISAFSCRTVIDWNSLPSSVVLSKSVNCFKSRLSDALEGAPIET